MFLRQEVKAVLRPLQKSFAPQHSRTDSDLGLDHMITSAKGVAVGIEERQYPLLLIGLHVVPQHGQHTATGKPGQRERAQTCTSGKDEAEEEQAEHQSG